MRRGKAWLKAWLTAAAIAACGATTDANAVSYEDILGNWCSTTARLELSRDAMGVFLFSDNSHFSRKVSSYEFGETSVTVSWYLGDNVTSSTFGEFSADGRTMVLQPSGDVPRRQYRRC